MKSMRIKLIGGSRDGEFVNIPAKNLESGKPVPELREIKMVSKDGLNKCAAADCPLSLSPIMLELYFVKRTTYSGVYVGLISDKAV